MGALRKNFSFYGITSIIQITTRQIIELALFLLSKPHSVPLKPMAINSDLFQNPLYGEYFFKRNLYEREIDGDIHILLQFRVYTNGVNSNFVRTLSAHNARVSVSFNFQCFCSVREKSEG